MEFLQMAFLCKDIYEDDKKKTENIMKHLKDNECLIIQRKMD